MLVRFPSYSGVQQISVEGGVGDTATLFFADNPRVLTILSKLINQNTLNLIKNIMFGGTGGVSAGGGFGEKEGLLTQMGFGQMHGMNELHNDLAATDFRVSVFSNGAVRIEYAVRFDRWSIERQATRDNSFEGDFEMTVTMELDDTGRRKRAEFNYRGNISTAEQTRAEAARKALKDQARESEIKTLERRLAELLSEKKYKASSTGGGNTFKKKNNWEYLDDFEKVVLDMSNPAAWHYHPDVLALTEMFRDYADVLKLMRKLDFGTHTKFKSHQKNMRKMQVRFEAVFRLYLANHRDAYEALKAKREDSGTEELESVLSQYVQFQKEVKSAGAKTVRLGRYLMPGILPGMAQLVSVRGDVDHQIEACDTNRERAFGYTGELSQQRTKLLGNRVLNLPSDTLGLVDMHLPIIIRGLQAEALLMLQSTHQAIEAQEHHDSSDSTRSWKQSLRNAFPFGM